MHKSWMKNSILAGVALLILGAGTAYTQFGGGGADWNTTGLNAQRTSWVKTDKYITKDILAQGDFKFQWKLKVEGQPRQLASIIGGTASGGGLSKPLNVIVSPNNTLTTVDNDTGIQGWVKHFNVAVPATGTLACPGGMSANASRPVPLAPPAATAGRGFGRASTGYRSILGEPGQGLPTEDTTFSFGPPPAAAPAATGARGTAPAAGAPAAAPGARGAAADALPPGFGPPAPVTYKTPFGGGRFGSNGGFYVVTSDGMLHTIADVLGVEIQAPVKFLPANARVSDLTAVPENNDAWHSYVVYASTTNSCGGVPNRVWAINLADDAKPIAHFDTGSSPVGTLAFSQNGTVFVAVGKGPAGSAYSNALIALEPKTLTVKDWFTDPKADFSSTPTVIKDGNKEIVAVSSKDGRVFLLEANSLGGSDHKTPLFVSPPYSTAKTDYAPAALASWQEADGSTYVAEPFAGPGPSRAMANGTVTNGGIVALKLSDDGGKVSLSPAWVSPDMTSPLAPTVVNGVMFAASSGEYYPPASLSATAAERAQKSSPAVLYALDAGSGKQMWSSGKTVTSFVASTPLWVQASQVYLATYDNTVYAFGPSQERYEPGQ